MLQTINARQETTELTFAGPTFENPFDVVNEKYAGYEIPEEIREACGTWALRDHVLLDVPTHISKANRIQTNPSPFVLINRDVNRHQQQMAITWVREEDALLHIGTTEAVPYYFSVKNSKPSLHEFPDAQAFQGEDARATPDVQMRSPIGRRAHTGWFISVVEAKRRLSKPDEAESITQIGYWGERLDRLEPVCEIKGSKNTTIVPRKFSGTPMIDVFTRPFPHIAHIVLGDPSDIDDNVVDESQENIITEDYLPDGYHMGPNNAQASLNPRLVILDTHEAKRLPNGDGRNALHYRLARAAFMLPVRGELPKGKFMPLQVLSERYQFPPADPKSPDSYVADYTNILYGAIGQYAWILVGIGDNRLAAARLQRV